MANQSDLITGVKDIVQDTAFPSTTILSLLNEAQRKIAGGVFILYPDRTQVLSSPLAALATTGSLTTSTTNSYISLPSDYGRNLYFLVSETNDIRITVYPSMGELLNSYPVLDNTGRLVSAAVSGSRLYYQGKPATAETLTAYYHRKAYEMATYEAATIGFTASTGVIADSASGLGVFYEGQKVDISGSTSNDGEYTITDVETDGSAMTVSGLTDEAESATVTIKSQPDGIPEHLHEDLLINYAAMKIFERKAISEKEHLQNIDMVKGLFNAALLNLEAALEEVPEPVIFKNGRW